jgi:hypothetical protein
VGQDSILLAGFSTGLRLWRTRQQRRLEIGAQLKKLPHKVDRVTWAK